MLPEGARKALNDGLEASGPPLGTMWVQSGRQERGKSHFKVEVEAMLGPPKMLKIDQDAKKTLPRQFFDSQEAKNDDSGPPRKRRPKTASPKTLILDYF